MRIQIIQKLIDKIRGKEARLKKTTEVVKQYRFIHIMFNDKFGKAWVDFVNKNFDTEEHLFLCKRWFDEFPFPLIRKYYLIMLYLYLNTMKQKKKSLILLHLKNGFAHINFAGKILLKHIVTEIYTMNKFVTPLTNG